MQNHPNLQTLSVHGNNVTTDISGNSRAVTTAGTPTFGSGVFGNSLDIANSSTNRTSIATSTIGTGSYSICVWVYVNTISNCILVANGYNNTIISGNQSSVTFNTTYGITFFAIETGSVMVIRNYRNTIDTGAWMHLAFVCDRTDQKLYSYKNGVLLTESADYTQNNGWSANISNTSPYKLGVSVSSGGVYSQPLNGKIEGFCFYNSALSKQDVLRNRTLRQHPLGRA